MILLVNHLRQWSGSKSIKETGQTIRYYTAFGLFLNDLNGDRTSTKNPD